MHVDLGTAGVLVLGALALMGVWAFQARRSFRQALNAEPPAAPGAGLVGGAVLAVLALVAMVQLHGRLFHHWELGWIMGVIFAVSGLVSGIGAEAGCRRARAARRGGGEGGGR